MISKLNVDIMQEFRINLIIKEAVVIDSGESIKVLDFSCIVDDGFHYVQFEDSWNGVLPNDLVHNADWYHQRELKIKP